MLRRPLCGMAAGLSAGIAAAAYGGRLWPAVFLAAAALYGGVIWRKRYASGQKIRPGTGRLRLRLACCIAMSLIGGFHYRSAECRREEYRQYVTDGMPLLVQGELSTKKFQNNQYIYELKSCIIGHSMEHQSEMTPVSCGRILVSSDTDSASIGEILILNGTADLFEPASNEGSFDEASYYETRGVAFRLKNSRLLGTEGNMSRVREGLWQLRLRVRDVYQAVMEPEEGGVLATMVLGDKGLLDAQTRKLYQAGGLSHIMAISGLHISVIGMALYRFLRKRGLGFLFAGAAAGGIMCAYGTMVGFGTSVQRAVFMFLMLLLAGALGRAYDTLNALGGAALLLLWGNPFLLWDAGFQFSFAAVLGAAWVSGAASYSDTWWGKAGRALFSGAAIQLATLPLAAWYYYEIPVYAIFMNLLILPLMGVLLAVGVAGGIAGLWSLRIAGVVLLPCQKLLAMIRWLCGVCAGLPGAMHVTGRPSPARLAVYYVILAAATLYLYRRKRQDVPARPFGLSMLAAGLLALLLVPPHRGFELDVLDVGQGDGCFVRTTQGYTAFVDGGSSDVKKVGEYRILPFLKYNGVRRIDCWVVSHADSDHISGLTELLEQGYEIRCLVLSAGIVRDEAHQKLETLAAENGTKLVYMDAGDSLYLGEARLLALHPSARTAAGTDRNAASLVLRYEEGAFTGLFTGDIGIAEEEKLLREMTGSVTFYKAAHHGSDHSNSKEWLAALRPLVTTVSCAAENSYGHPGEEAVAHIRASGSGIFFTMESGQIRLTLKHGAVRVWTYADRAAR